MIGDPFAPDRPWLADQMAKTEPAQHPALFPVDPSSVVGPSELSSAPAELTIRVIGEPVQQGSMKGAFRGGHVKIFADNEKTLRPWRQLVNDAAKATAARERWTRLDGAIEVGIVLFLERPKSAPRRRLWPEKFPDIDKLARAILDGLKPHAIVDDARIVHLEVWKRYATGDIPLGARIVVRNGVDSERPLRVLHPSVLCGSGDLSGGAS